MDNIVLTLEQLGPVLQGIRREHRLTQAAAAALVGLLSKTISGLESSPGKHSVESLFRLLSALELQMVLRPKPSASSPRRRAEW